MLTFQQKRFLRRVISSPLSQGFFLVLCLAALWSAYGRYQIAAEMAARRAQAEETLAALEARRAALAEEVAYITSERGIEAEMRRQFDVAREGEQVVIILDEPADSE
jgi:cell division protein FtsB